MSGMKTETERFFASLAAFFNNGQEVEMTISQRRDGSVKLHVSDVETFGLSMEVGASDFLALAAKMEANK